MANEFKVKNGLTVSTTNVIDGSGNWVGPDVPRAVNITGGALNRVPYQTAASTTSFVAAPTTNNTYLQYNGSTLVWGPAIATAIPWVKKTTAYTAVAGDRIIADTTAGAFTITLPATPSAGDTIEFTDGNSWFTNNLTIARNGSTIEGLADSIVFDVKGISVQFIYDGTTWQVTTTLGARGAQGLTGTGVTTRVINIVIDNDGSLITSGVKGEVIVDFPGTISSWTILGNASGSITVDVAKATYANFPTFTLSGGTSPFLSSSQKNTSGLNWSGFTTVAAGDILRFTVSGTITGVTRVTVALLVIPSV